MDPLLPIRHTTRDFFACNLFEALPYFKDDMASMEHPVFSLSTKPDFRVLHYEHNGNTITIKPSYDRGLATIHDKDILLYCASQLRAAIQQNRKPKQRIRFTAYDFFLSTNRRIDGDSYDRFKTGLERLQGTSIKTNIRTGGLTIEEGFGIIDAWRSVKEDESGRVIAVEIKVSDWFYNAVLSNELLTINRDYFRLRKPMERRLYELCRKHCGDQQQWKINLGILHKKIGTTAPLRKLRAAVKKIIETDHLPDYTLDMAEDVITVRRRKAASNASLDLLFFTPEIFEKAKAVAPGLDIYYLEQEFRNWIAAKPHPKNPDAAFIGFCKAKAKKTIGP